MYNPEIVIDGWIEVGKGATVVLTQSVMVHPEDNESEIRLQDIPIRWAKVTVSDGEREEILVGRMDEDIFPPYKYTGTAIKGEAGKKYSVKVEYSGRTVTAETTIPHAVHLVQDRCIVQGRQVREELVQAADKHQRKGDRDI